MIASQDRSGYFGASDTAYILGNTETKSFRKWWLEKIGLYRNNFVSVEMQAGTYFEHRILDFIGVTSKDKQIIIEDLKLRVNLDGDKDGCIYEVKTYKYKNGFKMPKKYINQVQVQMYATGCRKAKIVVYGLKDEDYKNFFNPIDKDRLKIFDIEYDEKFINEQYLPRLKYFSECLKKGVMPNMTTVKMTQTRKILKYIEKHGSITSLDAVNELGVMRLASRMTDLRKMGYKIVTEMEKSKNRDGQTVHYARYSICE